MHDRKAVGAFAGRLISHDRNVVVCLTATSLWGLHISAQFTEIGEVGRSA